MKRARSIALCVKPGGKSPMMGWSSTCDPLCEPRRRKPAVLRSRVCRRISCHWRRALPSQAPISLAHARRQAHARPASSVRSEEHTSELQSRSDLVCRLLLEKKKNVLLKTVTYESYRSD